MIAFRSLGWLAAAMLVVGLAAGAKAEKPKASKFDALKQLAGDWTVKAKHGEVEQEGTANYKVTSGGSAVAETLFAGTDQEMVTIYHLDGDDLVLTHYCMLHNQPQMKAERGGAADKLRGALPEN